MSIRFGRSGNGYDSSEVMETEDDDWRKVTDLNERRKIQNRLAQRNYRRKLRQRLEQLERQAGENCSTGATSATSAASATSATSATSIEPANNFSKRRRRQSSIEAIGKAGEKHAERNTTKKVSNLEDRSSTLSPTLSSVVRAEPPISRTTESVPQNLYAGDFGPLFTGPDARQRGIRQPDQQLQIWPQPYPHPQQQQQAYGQNLQLSYYHSSPPPSFPMTPTSHAESPASPSQQIQAYISLLPNDPPLPVSSSLTHRGEASLNTHTSCRLNARANIDPPGFPDLSPTYSANPSTNPNPYHLNGTPIPTDNFYLTLNYSTLFSATMEIAKILQMSEAEMSDDETISPFVTSGNSGSQLRLPENMDDLEPTKKQTAVVHHPYIDTIPFKGFRDRMLDYVRYGEETGDYTREEKVCAGMYEGWGVWGQVPWEGRSWEIGEAFARKYWFLMDEEMIKCANWWRRQRGMKPMKIQDLREMGRMMARERPTDLEEIGRVIGELEE